MYTWAIVIDSSRVGWLLTAVGASVAFWAGCLCIPSMAAFSCEWSAEWFIFKCVNTFEVFLCFTSTHFQQLWPVALSSLMFNDDDDDDDDEICCNLQTAVWNCYCHCTFTTLPLVNSLAFLLYPSYCPSPHIFCICFVYVLCMCGFNQDMKVGSTLLTSRVQPGYGGVKVS